MIAFFRAAARHRRPVLVAELVVACFVLVLLDSPTASPVALVIAAVTFGLGLSATNRYRPALLIAKPARSAFDTPVNPAQFLIVTAFVAFNTHSMTAVWRDSGFFRVTDSVLDLLLLALLAALFTAAWRDLGVRLRPDGLLDRQVLGSLFVPWEAFEPGSPPVPGSRNAELVFAYRRPELVRRRGIIIFSRRAIRVQNTDRAFLAAIIDHYVRHPDLRAAIGTEAELARLPVPGPPQLFGPGGLHT